MNQFLLFLHCPDLWNLVFHEESVFPCYSLPDMKKIWIDYALLVNAYKFMSVCLYLPNRIPQI